MNNPSQSLRRSYTVSRGVDLDSDRNSCHRLNDRRARRCQHDERSGARHLGAPDGPRVAIRQAWHAGFRFSKFCLPQPCSPSRSRASRSSSRSRRARIAAQGRRPMPPFLRSRRWSSCGTSRTASTARTSAHRRRHRPLGGARVAERRHRTSTVARWRTWRQHRGLPRLSRCQRHIPRRTRGDPPTRRRVHPPLVRGAAADQSEQHDRAAGSGHASPEPRFGR